MTLGAILTESGMHPMDDPCVPQMCVCGWPAYGQLVCGRMLMAGLLCRLVGPIR